MSQISVGVRDHGGEIGRATFNILIASADTRADLDAQGVALRAALNPITLGVIASTIFGYQEQEDGGTPVDPFAQRELGLRVLYHGNLSNRNFSVTIPAPDLDALTLAPTGDDVVLEDAGVMADFVDWIEANVEYPHGDAPGSEGVTVSRAYVVGRNN